MVIRIEKEMRAAQHLLYVSLKYTKTCDVMLNLIQRWQNVVDICVELLLYAAKKKKLIKEIPAAPKPRIEALQKIFKKEDLVIKVLALYTFFRKIHSLQLVREHEFRKNVALKIMEGEKEIVIDLAKLYEWQEMLENFIKFVKVYIK